jgi:hypothetical protein
MVTPITSQPCSFRSQAATLESTPPLIPTTTRRESGDGDGVLMLDHNPLTLGIKI